MTSLLQETTSAAKWSALDVFMRQGVQFVITIVLARILAPEDFGVIAMLALFIGVASIFIDSGKQKETSRCPWQFGFSKHLILHGLRLLQIAPQKRSILQLLFSWFLFGMRYKKYLFLHWWSMLLKKKPERVRLFAVTAELKTLKQPQQKEA